MKNEHLDQYQKIIYEIQQGMSGETDSPLDEAFESAVYVVNRRDFRIKELTEALKFYASEENWNGTFDLAQIMAGKKTGPAAWQDSGDLAREKLFF